MLQSMKGNDIENKGQKKYAWDKSFKEVKYELDELLNPNFPMLLRNMPI
ncbi:MAG: hypothetical protein SFT93_04050 [Rickettsiaceae bacterium]|nr:hypothetical protein [Rickettsiaceae bacterium]